MNRPKVTEVFCEHCQTWVKARRYSPIYYCCNDCQRALTAAGGSQHRTARQAAALTHHLHLKRTRQWRRNAAIAKAHRRTPPNELRMFRHHTAQVTAIRPRPFTANAM